MTNNSEKTEQPMIVQTPYKNIQVSEDGDRNLAILKVYGTILEPEEYIEEFNKLNQIALKFNAIEITLNSPGGSLNSTIDLFTILKKFDYIITIGVGEIASAAFMLWTLGNIKVVTEYSMYMAHRESYGMYGKTSEHKATALVFGSVYEDMFEQCFGDILTEQEKIIADRSETWISYKELLNRDGIISYDNYIQPKNPYIISDFFIISSSDKYLMFDESTQMYRTIKITFGDEVVSDMNNYLYGVEDIIKLKKVKKNKK